MNYTAKESVDKPWLTEPDRKEWIDPATGYQCLIVRILLGGHLCGYVGIPANHSLNCLACDDIPVDAHGYLTYSEGPNEVISHPGAKEPASWWLGFDCAHTNDLSPASPYQQSNSVYRDFKYVEGQVTSLAQQLKLLE